MPRIEIISFKNCLLSTVFGFYDILNFADRNFAAGFDISVIDREVFEKNGEPPDLVFIPAFLDFNPGIVRSENKAQRTAG